MSTDEAIERVVEAVDAIAFRRATKDGTAYQTQVLVTALKELLAAHDAERERASTKEYAVRLDASSCDDVNCLSDAEHSISVGNRFVRACDKHKDALYAWKLEEESRVRGRIK